MTTPERPASRLSDKQGPSSPRIAVLVPIYDHGRTVEQVLTELGRYGLPIIAINDGSTDTTPAVLEQWTQQTVGEAGPLRHVRSHGVNQGKAAALRTGFAEASRLGFTHVATIDADGQHDPADLQRLIECCTAHPTALILGARAKEGSHAPGASRVGRSLSNRLVWLESGVRVTDSQSGMRIYPLAHMPVLSGSAPRYGFETEVLARAGWHAICVVEAPIRCIYRVPGGRTTHFRLVGDTMASVRMHAGLLARALLPGPGRLDQGDDERTGTIPRRLGRWFSPRRLLRMARGQGASRERLAASVGVGLLMATLPVYGVKTVACLWLSGRFRLHPLAVIGTSSLSTPPLGLVFAALSIYVGGLLLHGQLPDLSGIGLEQARQWSTINTLVAEWLVGSVITGVVLGLLGYGALRVVLAAPTAPPRPTASAPGSSPIPPSL
ncbi:MAG: DUF2062 domain-containing protein [Phycisphaerales bacterium]|nr:DUF2062 domain-containing protein [Phycisphaerales bacterium]